MVHEFSNGWRTFAVYHQADERGVCVRAASRAAATDAERTEIELWTNYRWGNCRAAGFGAALIQAPFAAVHASPTHLLALVLPGIRYRLKLPIRFVVLIPDHEFARCGFDGFALYRAGVFAFAEQFDPDHLDSLLPAGAPPPPTERACALEAAEMAAALERRESVILQAECLTPAEWPTLEQVWASCSPAVRQGASLITQTFTQDVKGLGWCFACQFVAGRTWGQADADWRRIQANRSSWKGSPGSGKFAVPVTARTSTPAASADSVDSPASSSPRATVPPFQTRTGLQSSFGTVALVVALGTAAFAGWQEREYRRQKLDTDAELTRLRAEIGRRLGPDEPLPAKWIESLDAAQAKATAASNASNEWAIVAQWLSMEAYAAAAEATQSARVATSKSNEVANEASAAANSSIAAETAAKHAGEAAKKAEQAAADAVAAAEKTEEPVKSSSGEIRRPPDSQGQVERPREPPTTGLPHMP